MDPRQRLKPCTSLFTSNAAKNSLFELQEIGTLDLE